MFRKHTILTGILIALALLFVAAAKYPGGSQKDVNSVGFSWQHNYMSNLFADKAVNGADNPSTGWAMAGMMLLCSSFAVFFIGYAKLIPNKVGALVITYSGIASMLFAFLTVTRYHDLMITLSSLFTLLCMFYITIFILKTKLHFFKIFSILLLLTAYLTNYMFYARQVTWLPVMQKVHALGMIAWVLSLHYCTSAGDFKKTSRN